MSIQFEGFQRFVLIALLIAGTRSGGGVLVADEAQIALADAAKASAMETREVIAEKIVTEAVVGSPLGAGRIELSYAAGHGPVIYPDQRLSLAATDERVRYATFNIDYQPADVISSYQVKRIEALFLLSGEGPVDFTLGGPHGTLVQESIEPVANNVALLDRMRHRWWNTFSALADDISESHRQLNVALLEILARRHGFSIPKLARNHAGSKAEQLQGLEAQFERGVGLLFGIERAFTRYDRKPARCQGLLPARRRLHHEAKRTPDSLERNGLDKSKPIRGHANPCRLEVPLS